MSKPLDLSLKLVLGGGIILLPLAVSLVGGAFVFSDALNRADRTIVDIDSIKHAFDASREIATERTQAARLLTGQGAAEPIAAIRERVDRAVLDLALLDRRDGAAGEDPAVTVNIGRVRSGLVKARAELDELRQSGRELAPGAVGRMFSDFADVSDAAQAAAERVALRLGSHQFATVPTALAAISLNDLSDVILDTGLLVMPAILTHQPLSERDRDAFVRLRERLTQAWQAGLRHLTVMGDMPVTAAARNQAATRLWHDAIDVIDRAVDPARSLTDPTLRPATVLDASGAAAVLVDRLQSIAIDQAEEKIAAQRSEMAVWRAIFAGFFAVAIITSLIVMALVWRRVVSPLFLVGHKIRALARLEPVGAVASPTGQPEIASIFEAVEDLFIVLEERAEHTQQLKQLAETDGLTGLMNRRLLDRIGEGAVEFDHLPRAVSVILMDLDRFKSINDTYGHTSGDLVLRQAARLAQRVCRKTDLVARYGGEEIAILIFDQDPWVAGHVAERIRSELESMPVRLEDGRLLTVTASFGVAHGRRGGKQWLDVLNGADEALYRAKGDGRNRVCSHEGKADHARRVA
jgi:diguanylate cyclase (GGDEF)-like protein